MEYLHLAEQSVLRLVGQSPGKLETDEALNLFLALAERNLGIDSPEDSDFIAFCSSFGLPEDQTSRDGYEKLAATSLAEAELSVRVIHVSDSKNIHRLIQACRLNKATLRSFTHFRPTCMAELQAKASEVSGLSLVWR